MPIGQTNEFSGILVEFLSYFALFLAVFFSITDIFFYRLLFLILCFCKFCVCAYAFSLFLKILVCFYLLVCPLGRNTKFWFTFNNSMNYYCSDISNRHIWNTGSQCALLVKEAHTRDCLA